MTRFEAFFMALELAITAPTEGLCHELLGIAKVLARDMSSEEIECAQYKVVKRLSKARIIRTVKKHNQEST